jgi:myo-inositol 2-dehydrogenase/D-chiro-inositol 1-dehydrogenase
VRIGVYGLGRIGTMHARNVAQAAGVDEVVLIGRDPARLAAAHDRVGELLAAADGAQTHGAAESGHARVTTTSDALGDVLPGLDGVIVATATATHAELARLVASAHTPLLIEKPLALTTDELQALSTDLESTGTPIMVAFQRRYDAGYQGLREQVRKGAVGTLRTVTAHDYDHHPLRLEYIPDSRGMWIDLLVHDFDIISWVTGDEVVEVTSVGSVLDEPTYERYRDADTCIVLLRFASGAVGTVAGLRRSDAGQDVRLEIVGSHGAFAAGFGPHTPITPTDPGVPGPVGVWDDYAERFRPAFHAETKHFVAMVRGEVESLTPPSAGLAATRIAEAAAESFRSGRSVRV